MARATFTPAQQKAIMLLATGATNDKVAESVSVTPRTLSVWMHRDEFRAEVRHAMERMRHVFEGRMMALAGNAAAVVQEMMGSKELSVRADGARMALNAAVRLANRYKELQVEGYTPPPMFVLPPGTTISTVRTEPVPPPNTPPRLIEGAVVDVVARPVPNQRPLVVQEEDEDDESDDD